MEALLQLMLKWDPVQRGGRVNSDNKKPQCFEVMEQILSMRVSYLTFNLEMRPFFRLLSHVHFGQSAFTHFSWDWIALLFFNI